MIDNEKRERWMKDDKQRYKEKEWKIKSRVVEQISRYPKLDLREQVQGRAVEFSLTDVLQK